MSGGLHSLATIIKRLEAATSRIEDLAQSSGWGADGKQDELNVKDEPSPSSYIAPPPPPPPPPPPAAPVGMSESLRSVTAFDETIINDKLKVFTELTNSFTGDNVKKIVALVGKQFEELRAILVMGTQYVKPSQDIFQKYLTPLQKSIVDISSLKEKCRSDRDWFTHLTVITEGAPVVGWVIEDKPGPYINGVQESVQYYTNKVLKEFREKNPKHPEWVRAYLSLLEELRKYVMEYHTTGLVWNAKGIVVPADPAAMNSSAPTLPAPTNSAGGAEAVFAELNRGADVTKGLRKVDKSEMTHKNPALRNGNTVPAASPPSHKKPVRPSKPQALMGKKPSKFALEGKSWTIEYYEDDRSLVLKDCQISQVVNIFGCKNCVIQIKGKVNAVTMVNCTKTSFLVDNVVSSISVTKSPSFALQITGLVPMIQIDSTDSGQIYLSKKSLSTEISTAKCSAINVSLPVEGEEDGVFEEQVVPEMLKSVVKDGKLVTTIVEHIG